MIALGFSAEGTLISATVLSPPLEGEEEEEDSYVMHFSFESDKK